MTCIRTFFFLVFILTCLSTAEAQITSTFDSSADGWTFTDTGTPISVDHHTANGNPAGYISATYNSNTTAASEGWFAPAKFLGAHAARSYGMNLKFDLQQSFTGTSSSGQGDVRIETSSGFDIVFSFAVKPAVAPAWSSYTIRLDETAGWRVGSTGGALATKTDILRALSKVVVLEIRGTYTTNASNTSGLDNVVLEQKTLVTPPAITAFTPLSGIPGAAITITGNNFGATAAQNVVYFGTTKATVTSGNSTQLTANIPAGAQFGAITVINSTTGLTTQSLQSFSPLFNNNNDSGGRIIPSSLDLKDDLTLAAGRVIQGLSLGDLDGDGLVDIIVSEPAAGVSELSVFRNLGVTDDINASSFAPKITLGRGWGENAVVDLDNDGKLDIVVIDTDFVSYSFFVTYRNVSTPGNIAFEAAESFVNPPYATGSMHIADIDGDGRIDLMGTHPSTGIGPYFWTTQNLSTPGDILLGAGVVWTGSFAGSGPMSTADIDGDGRVEIFVVHGGTFSIFPNISTPGSIDLGTPVLIDPAGVINKITITDLDDDNKPDLIWPSGDLTTTIRIRKNIHGGGAITNSSFDPEIVIPSSTFGANDITLADMNGDGKLDIVGVNTTHLGIFERASSGTLSTTSFKRAVLFQGNTFAQNPLRPVIADLDGDNKPDVVSATSGSTPMQVFIFRNTCYPAPTIASISPAIGEVGTPLTVSGNFMNTNFDTPIAKFGSAPSATGSVSNSSLTTSIPTGAQSGRLSVSLHGLTAFSKPYTVTFQTSRTIDATSFSNPVEFPLTAVADGLTIADFDDDGKKDVVVNDNGSVRIFRNTLSSAGAAVTMTTLTAIGTTYTLGNRAMATDIDGDGKIDLLANTAIHRNNSGSTADPISFEPYVQHIISSANGFVVDHDFNHDGKTDFAYTTNGNTYQVEENASRKGSFTNAGGGPFSTIVNSSIGTAAGGQVMGIVGDDFDGDGYDDFAFGVNAGADILAVVRNTGLNESLAPAQFEAAVTFPALDIPFSIASADFDGDGKRDIVLGNSNAAFISIYRNTSTPGSLSFLAKQDIATLTRAIDIEAVDLDGDGKAEIIVAHQPSSTTGSFSVFQNTSIAGTISFSAAINYPLSRGPLALEIADVNIDGKPDLIFTANGTTDALMIFENAISTGPVITISPQPVSTSACEGANASFTLAASGTTNITFQWQKFDGSVFNNISNSGGYSGTNTSTLTINTTGNFGAGDYRCRISGDGASDKFSNTVTLTINPVPTAPSTTGDSDCAAAALTLTASGGSNGQYRWYNVATSGTAIAGQTNGSYTTPVIPTTTIYYVAINNGSCESQRAPVTATIAPIAKPVITFDPPIFNAGSTINLCEGVTQTFSAPDGFVAYNWSTGQGTQDIIVDQSDTYSVTVEDNNGCISPPSDPLIVVINPFPLAEIDVDGTTLTASPGDSYQWFYNGEQIPGATDQTFQFNVLEYGVYSVGVTDNTCTATSDDFVYLITGVESRKNGWSVSPNPFHRELVIKTPTEGGEYDITVIDALGKTVRNIKSHTGRILLDDLSEGIYLLRITTRYETIQFRIIKDSYVK